MILIKNKTKNVIVLNKSGALLPAECTVGVDINTPDKKAEVDVLVKMGLVAFSTNVPSAKSGKDTKVTPCNAEQNKKSTCSQEVIQELIDIIRNASSADLESGNLTLEDMVGKISTDFNVPPQDLLRGLMEFDNEMYISLMKKKKSKVYISLGNKDVKNAEMTHSVAGEIKDGKLTEASLLASAEIEDGEVLDSQQTSKAVVQTPEGVEVVGMKNSLVKDGNKDVVFIDPSGEDSEVNIVKKSKVNVKKRSKKSGKVAKSDKGDDFSDAFIEI